MMDYAISFHYGSLHIPSTINRAVRVTRPLSSFKHSSLSLSSSGSTHRALSRHALSPVVCAHNRLSSTPSTNDKDNGGKFVKLVLGGAPLVFACVIGIVNCQFNFTPTAIAASYDPPSRPPTEELILTRPKYVLETFLEVPKQLTIPKPSWRKNPFKSRHLKVPEKPENNDYTALKSDIAHLIKQGKSDEAEKQLRELVQNLKGGPIAYEVELELVVLLILQGRYGDALKCSCLKNFLNDDGSVQKEKNDVGPSDGRPYLYMAINYTMLEKNENAKICWKKYISSFDTIPPKADGNSPQGLPYR